jgi:hypothetical protein
MSLHFGISETIVFPEWVTNDNKSKNQKNDYKLNNLI